MECGSEEVGVCREDGCDGCCVNFVAATIEEGAYEGKHHVDCAVIFCLEHAFDAVRGEEAVEGFALLCGGKVNVKSRCGEVDFDICEDVVCMGEKGASNGFE